MNKDFKKKWRWPKIDADTGLFKEKKNTEKYKALIKQSSENQDLKKLLASGLLSKLGKS